MIQLSDADVALPEPDELALEHSARLTDVIKLSGQSRLLSFSDYMQMALYEPGLGYYMAGAQKFGAKGDFITAPEVSNLFGVCIAEQIREVLVLTGGSVLELGAGSGKLALSILRSMQDSPPEQYFILEPSAELQHRQRRMLSNELDSALFDRIAWLDALPEQFVGVCVANEVMDAMPVEIFVKAESGLQQLHVNTHNNSKEFSYQTEQAGDALVNAVDNIEAELKTELETGK